MIKPTGAFVTLQLLKAIRRCGEPAANGRQATRGERTLTVAWRSVRPTHGEATESLPGADLIADPVDSLTHAIAIRRPPRDVWRWLVQMGAGSRAGWYSHDFLDNGRQATAVHIIPDLQQLVTGMLFPALPGITDCFTLLAFNPDRFLILGWVSGGTAPLMTWAFVLEEIDHSSTRMIVRARRR